MPAVLVQSSGARSGNGTTEQWTWAVAPTVGNVIIVKAVGWASPTGPTTSCTDTATNSYTQRTNALSTGSGATTTRAAIFDCVIASSPTSTTITWSTSADHSVVFEEWSGLDTASLSDQVATPALSGLISGSGGQSLTVGPTGTLAQADELVQTLLGAATGTASSNITTPSGYMGGVFEQNSPSFVGMGSAYKTVAATTAVDATWTFSTAGTTGQSAVALLATYRVAASPPTITAQPTDQTANNGATATFSVTATGATSYQWKKNGVNISGATSSSVGIAAAYADQGAQITVDCINSGGTTTSSAATLRVAFNLTGTGSRAYPILGGGPIGAGTVEAWLRGTDAGGAPSHATTGALAADAATLAGTATHFTLHATTGSLSAQASTVSGAAQHQHATTGALSAQAATIAGTATHLTLHSTTGALSSQAAVIAGAAAHEHAASGALSSQAAAIAGAAAHEHAASGALSAQTAAVAGTATHFTLHTTTGALGAPDATIAGTAAHQHAATGALSAQAASIAGSADHTVAGATHTTTGALAAQDSTLTGSSAHLTLHSTTGALSAQESTVAGSAGHPHTTAGALSSQSAAVAGSAAHATLHATSGALGAQTASVSGAAAHEHATTGALAAGAAGIAGAALRIDAGVHATEGALQAQEATLSGSATLTPNPDNALTDPKFQGPSHNTRIRWERKRKEEAAAAEEPDLVEPPASEPIAPAPKPRSTGLGEITAPPVEVRAPEIKIPEIKVIAPAKTAAAEPESTPAPATVAAAPAVEAPAAEVKPVASPAPPAITSADMARVEREMTAFVEGAVAGLTKQLAALEEALRARTDELAAARREIADLRKREINRQRAEELARKIAEADE